MIVNEVETDKLRAAAVRLRGIADGLGLSIAVHLPDGNGYLFGLHATVVAALLEGVAHTADHAQVGDNMPGLQLAAMVAAAVTSVP
jgi:hypothetical protein